MNKLNMTLIMLFCFWLIPADALPKSRRHAAHSFVYLIDHGGLNARPEENYRVIKDGLSFFLSLRKLGKFADSQLDIIGLGEGKILWSGTPRKLIAQEKKVLETISMKSNMCADLPRGFKSLETMIKNIERRRFKFLHIFVYSPMIHSGLPCEAPKIKLPQIPPVNFNFAKAVSNSPKIKTILFFNVNPEQMDFWGVSGILEPLLAWHDQGPEYNFHIFDEVSSALSFETEVRGIFNDY